MTEVTRVLVVDDDRALRDAVALALRLEGYEVALATEGQQALRMLARELPDLVVLDVAMPMMGGIDACRRMRAAGFGAPVLMLTARDRIADRVAGLDAGADDYLVKPFALDELLARMRALLRRRTGSADDGVAGNGSADELGWGHLVLDPRSHRASCGDRELALTLTEFSLLELFLLNPDHVLPRELIMDRVWRDPGMSSKVLDVYVGYLRRKLEADGEPRVIHTVRSVGYVLRERP